MHSFSKEISKVLVVYTFLETFVFKTVVEIVISFVFKGCDWSDLSPCGRVRVYGIETCLDDVPVTSGP
jgi:hypothetical protein